MSGLVSGFQAGFNMMDRYYRNKEDDRRWNIQNERAETLHGLQVENLTRDGQIKQHTIDRLPELDRQADASFNAKLTLTGLQSENAEMEGELKGKQLKNYDADHARKVRADNAQIASSEAATAASKASTESSTVATRANNLRVQEAERKAKLDEARNAFSGLENIMAAYEAGMGVNFQDVYEHAKKLEGTQYDVLFNPVLQETARLIRRDMSNGGKLSQELLVKLNNGGLPELKKSVGKPGRFGAPITDVAIVNMEPVGGNKFKLQVMVRDADGNVYPSEVNEGRDASGGILSFWIWTP
ncbi:hypothetical protein ACFQMB_14320 [Pseudobowmanella zhangzhouensis]|uniref:hypothetical protein n=1 Tax=Pseudobowmanella zhangzhouensis TaxID=1537679 RepID=UPI0036201E2D